MKYDKGFTTKYLSTNIQEEAIDKLEESADKDIEKQKDSFLDNISKLRKEIIQEFLIET